MSRSSLAYWHPGARAILKSLKSHFERLSDRSGRNLFDEETGRFASSSLHTAFTCAAAEAPAPDQVGALLADWSREPLDAAAWADLLRLPDAVNMQAGLQRLFAGEVVNDSEELAMLAPACRLAGAERASAGGAQSEQPPIPLPDRDISAQIAQSLERMLEFAESFRQGALLGATKRPLRTLVNIGIGGSDQGVRLVRDAFGERLPLGVEVLCACCEQELAGLLPQLQPEETLFLINSKSFATAEILQTAGRAQDWLRQHLAAAETAAHLAAATSNPAKAQALGVSAQRIFVVPAAVGGRYSLWSCSGLAAAAVLGRTGFLQLLAGGSQADADIWKAAQAGNWAQSVAVRLALKDLWHQGVESRFTRLVLPYVFSLKLLPACLGQLEMESLGKTQTAAADGTLERSGQMVWGAFGPGAQHSFYQLLYQGTHRVHADMIALAADPDLDMQYAQCLAQAQALSRGSGELSSAASPVPVTVLVLDAFNPLTLGFLLAMWEHRVFVQARIMNVNPFDQAGVEYGKRLAASLLREGWSSAADPATSALAKHGKSVAG